MVVCCQEPNKLSEFTARDLSGFLVTGEMHHESDSNGYRKIWKMRFGEACSAWTWKRLAQEVVAGWL